MNTNISIVATIRPNMNMKRIFGTSLMTTETRHSDDGNELYSTVHEAAAHRTITKALKPAAAVTAR